MKVITFSLFSLDSDLLDLDISRSQNNKKIDIE